MTEKEILKDKKAIKIFAVSGGPDSMYLLDYYRQKFDPETIVVAHVNYNFRDDSMIDQNLVEHFCQKHGLKFELATVNPEIYENLWQNFEEFARTFRYDFFIKLGQKYSSEVIFVAHNQNDLVETYLLQKARQSLVSYYGLAKLSQYQGMWIYRPLLHLKKSFILEWNDKQQIPYHIDKTNADLNYARNKIRYQLEEMQLDSYTKEIDKRNKILLNETKHVEKYLKNNLQNKVLKLKKSFFDSKQEIQKRIIYAYFQQTNQEELLLKRKKQTLNEILKLINNQTKPVLKLLLKDAAIIKDFDELYVVDKSFLNIKVYLLRDFPDLEKIGNPKLASEIKKMIELDQEKWPYQLTNDYDNYKKSTFVKTKKTNRYFIDHKIRFRNRILVFALINNNNQVINIKSFFKLWDN